MADRIDDLRSGRILAVASTGGHLAQLNRLVHLNGWTRDRSWVTFDHPQSRALLKSETVDHVPYMAPRDWLTVVRSWPEVWSILRARRPDAVVSTGSAIAIAVFPVAFLLGIRRYYVESIARTSGPSLTGRLVSLIPGTLLYTQHRDWASSKWRLSTSVLDSWSGSRGERRPVSSVFVTLGTIKPYRFDSLVDSLLRSAPEDVSITWQLGETLRDDVPGRYFSSLSADDFESEVDSADVVVTHAGAGTVLQLLEARCAFVLVPRRRARGEHVDDHQMGIADIVDTRGLAAVVDVEDLTWETILAASEIRIDDVVRGANE